MNHGDVSCCAEYCCIHEAEASMLCRDGDGTRASGHNEMSVSKAYGRKQDQRIGGIDVVECVQAEGARDEIAEKEPLDDDARDWRKEARI